MLRASCDIRLHISELTGGDEKALDRSCFPFCQVQDKLPLLSTRHEVNNPQRSCYNQLPVQEHILADSFFTATATFLQSRVVSCLLGLLCLVSFGGLGLGGEFLHFVTFFAKNASFVPDLHFGVLNTRNGVAETTPHWNLEAHVQELKRVCFSDALFSRESFDMLPMFERLLYDPRSYLQFVGFKGASQQTLLTGGAADITNKDIGMLTQRTKASHAGYAPAQIRMVLLCDTKLTKRMLQQSENKVVLDMFLAATKGLGILPLKASDPKDFPSSSSVPKPNVEKPTKDKNPAPSKQNKSVLKLDPKAWNVPTKSHEDIKPDVSAVAMISDSSLACQLYSKCRHSNATIALVAPRDLAINGCRPTMAIIPFIQSQEGYQIVRLICKCGSIVFPLNRCNLSPKGKSCAFPFRTKTLL